MNKLNGSALVQYAIILSLLSVAVISVYMFFGQQINAILNSYLGIFTKNNYKVAANAKILASQPASQNNVSANSLKAGSMGGTPSNPVQSCAAGNCTVDFGSYILSGVPDNLTETLSKSGTSGGFDEISNLIMQIAQQLEDQGDLAGAQDYRDLANLGHYLATGSKTFEDLTRQSMSDGVNHLSDGTLGAINFTPPANVSHIITATQVPPGNIVGSSLGSARANKLSGYTISPQSKASDIPSYAFMDLYDKIQASSKYPPELKGITTALYLKTNDLLDKQQYNYSVYSVFSSLPNNPNGYQIINRDPLTGAVTTTNTVYITPNQSPTSNAQDILSTQIGGNQDLNSVLICAAGNNKDVNNKCNK